MEPRSGSDAEVQASVDLQGLTGERLRTVADLWKRSQRQVVARFSGSSMEPAIPPGAEVLLGCGATPVVGDVVAFVEGERLVVHRVVGIGRRFILTQGDAQGIPDLPLWDAGAVVGAVLRVRTGGEWRAPAAAPSSVTRRPLVASCLVALRVHPTLGVLFLRALRAAWRTLAPRGSS